MAYVVKRGDRFTGYYRKGGKRLSAGTWDSTIDALYHASKAEVSGVSEPSRAVFTLSTYIDSWLPTADLMPIDSRSLCPADSRRSQSNFDRYPYHSRVTSRAQGSGDRFSHPQSDQGITRVCPLPVSRYWRINSEPYSWDSY